MVAEPEAAASDGLRDGGDAQTGLAVPAQVDSGPLRAAGTLAARVSSVADRAVFWLSRRWLRVVNGLALLYVGLPLLAPLLMYLGAEWPARVVHAIYRPLCHQLPQRSFFLFGPQATYRYEQLAARVGAQVTDNPWSGAFLGSPDVGYKTALCQRDIAIYGMIVIAGLLFGILRTGRRVRPMPLWAYVAFGVLPMLVDGGYQWISYALATLFPRMGVLPHETTPVFRVVTGSLFGLSTVWLAYPHVEDTMEEVRESLEGKVRRRANVARSPSGARLRPD
jgi:uncharacterized membrane protein